MKLSKDKQKLRHSRQLVLLFFQVPETNLLTKIGDYIKNKKVVNFEYYCNEKLTVTYKYAGNISEFPNSFHENPADELIVIGYPSKNEVSQEFLLTLKLSGATIKLLPGNLDLFAGLLQVKGLRDLPHIPLFPNRTSIFQQVSKTLLTQVAAILGLTFTTLLFPFIALSIKITSEGPVFYKQKRLGKNAKPFDLYKFRTMNQYAEKEGPQLSSSNDPRITSIGRILRYWHIDELPQFWNILKGDMALVGPRPERPFFARFLAQKIPYYKIIYQQKPGLTSLGMIKYGYASSIEEMTDRLYYDIVYLNNPSMGMDLKILMNTIRYIVLKTFYHSSEKRVAERKESLKMLTSAQDPLVRWLSFKNKVKG